MGASSSTPQSPALHEQESIAASTVPLATLRAAFSNLSPPNPNPNPVHAVFSLESITITSESVPSLLAHLLPNIAPSIVSHFFPNPTALTWLDFLQGYNNCCARTPASASLTSLLIIYHTACERAGIPSKLEVRDIDKIGGSLSGADLEAILLVCWIMARGEGGGVVIPEVGHLVRSAFVECGAVADDENVWEWDGAGGGERVEVQKVVVWMVGTVPGITGCLPLFVKERLKACAASTDNAKSDISANEGPSPDSGNDKPLLTCGMAWAIYLSIRSTLREELLGSCFPGTPSEQQATLLYRSSIHGKGLTRFWSGVEGYHGPMLIIISATSKVSSDDDSNSRKWVIGVLIEEGFENRDTFYGSTGHLYAISPIFRVLPPSGKERNFIYSHLHPSVKAYDPHPKPVGLAFGGTIGNERIHIDEDFHRVTIQHHAYDKTYQHGSLIPHQGFLPVEALLLVAEVWGLGGKAAKEKQTFYQKREELFADQRRKVDLKTFGNWEDSPEKAMMDMVSDPNRVRREDR